MKISKKLHVRRKGPGKGKVRKNPTYLEGVKKRYWEKQARKAKRLQKVGIAINKYIIKPTIKKSEKILAENIINDERSDQESFWFGTLNRTKEGAQKQADRINQVLAGTGAKADIEFARNYNNQGMDWGISIRNYTKEADAKLIKKYGITPSK
jgi:hypothetical protein